MPARLERRQARKPPASGIQHLEHQRHRGGLSDDAPPAVLGAIRTEGWSAVRRPARTPGRLTGTGGPRSYCIKAGAEHWVCARVVPIFVAQPRSAGRLAPEHAPLRDVKLRKLRERGVGYAAPRWIGTIFSSRWHQRADLWAFHFAERDTREDGGTSEPALQDLIDLFDGAVDHGGDDLAPQIRGGSAAHNAQQIEPPPDELFGTLEEPAEANATPSTTARTRSARVVASEMWWNPARAKRSATGARSPSSQGVKITPPAPGTDAE